MNLDIRLPIGLLFSVLGLILVVFGITANSAIYDRSLGINVNLWWGLVMLAFGVLMFVFGRRGTSAVRTANESPEGRKLEATEARRDQPERRGGH